MSMEQKTFPEIDALALVLNAWLKRFPRKQAKVPPLSHYTSAAGLLGICSTNVLWATCAQYSNDRSEVLYAQSVGKEVIEEFLQGKNLTKGGEFLRTFLERQTGLIEGIEVKDAYITSFCESKDLLSQWRAYGQTAGFEMRFGPLVTEDQSIGSPAMGTVTLVQVEYDRQVQKEMLIHILNGALEVLKTVEAENLGLKFLDVGVATFAALEFMQWLYGIKHPSFSEEKEWRIVAFPRLEVTPFSQLYAYPEALKFRVGRHSLVPYVEFSPSKGKLPLTEVVCGPGGHQKLTSKAVELMMAATGFADVKVSNSVVPLAL